MTDGVGLHVGPYELIRSLGAGGMADIWLARRAGPAAFEKKCVLKRIRKELVSDERFVAMFLREARIVADLNHQNIVQVFDLGEDDGAYFIAMEYVDGVTLETAAQRSWKHSTALPIEVICKLIADAALGLGHAHARKPAACIHRDVSPDNLIVSREGTCKVLDFGIARSDDIEGLTAATELKGKLPYMSPEQIEGKSLDGRSDIWSLGVVFYALVTGHRPFEGATTGMLVDAIMSGTPVLASLRNAYITPRLDSLLQQMLQRDRKLRLCDTDRLHDDLTRIAGSYAAPRWAARFVEHVQMLGAQAERPFQGPAAAIPTEHWLASINSEATVVMRPGHESIMAGIEITAPDGIASDTPAMARATDPEGERVTPARAGIFSLAPTHAETSSQPSQPPARVSGAVAEARRVGAPFRRSPRTMEVLADLTPRAWTAWAVLALGVVVVVGAVYSALSDSETEVIAEPFWGEAVADPVAPIPGSAPALPKPVATAEAVAAPTPATTPTTPRPSDAEARRRSSTQSVTLVGPRQVRWRTLEGKSLPGGTVELSAHAAAVVAVDPLTGGAISVPVRNGQARFSDAPTGELLVQAIPWADVRIGKKALGPTPLAPIRLAAGRYTVTLTQGTLSREVAVVVGAGARAVLRQKMAGP